MIGYVTDWLTVAIDLARPKSANFARQSESSRILEGFRSLWMSSPECIYLIPLSTLNITMRTGRGHISYVLLPWCWPWWLHGGQSPWNRRLNIYLCCFLLWGYWVGRRYWDGHWVLGGRWPRFGGVVLLDMCAAHLWHSGRHRKPSSERPPASFACRSPSIPRHKRPFPTFGGFRIFARCEATVLRPCPLNYNTGKDLAKWKNNT